MAPPRIISASEVAEHTSSDSCWIILHSGVYDVSSLLATHPGGPNAILTHAGTDATAVFDAIHPSDTLSQIPESLKLGQIDPATFPTGALDKPASPSAVPVAQLPPLNHQLNLDDFERTASQALSKKAWAYYSSAANDMETLRLNREIYSRILLRPRMFRDVSSVDVSTTLLGTNSSLPVFISPAAAARLAHPDGEAAICRAAGKEGVVQCVSNNASMTVEEISSARTSQNQKLWWQLYIQVDRRKSEDMLRRVSRPDSGFTAVVLTLDAPWPGKREDDERASLPPLGTVPGEEAAAGPGVGKQLFAGTESSITWHDLAWVRCHTHLPIILKGIQTHQDAVIAASHPEISAIILSNHGGRALDTSPPGILILLEIRRYCPWVLQKIEVYVDGGIRRGTDVLKCIALGAKAVGVGRPVLYSLAGYGEDGVRRMLQIVRDEVETGLRLLGVAGVEDKERWKGWGRDGVPVDSGSGGPKAGSNGEGLRGREEYVNFRRVEEWMWRPMATAGPVNAPTGLSSKL